MSDTMAAKAVHDASLRNGDLDEDWREARKRYRIERLYFKGGKRLIMSGLTLKEAQEHCRDPESSSSTCTKASNRARTRRMGKWFDSYTLDN